MSSPRRTISTRKFQAQQTPSNSDMSENNDNTVNPPNFNQNFEENDNNNIEENQNGNVQIQEHNPNIMQFTIEEQRRQAETAENNKLNKQREKTAKEQRLLLEAQNKAREIALKEREMEIRERSMMAGPSSLPPPNMSGGVSVNQPQGASQHSLPRTDSRSNFMVVENCKQTITNKSEYEGIIHNQYFRTLLSQNVLELFDNLKEWFLYTRNLPVELNSRGGIAWIEWGNTLKRILVRIDTAAEFYESKTEICNELKFIKAWLTGVRDDTRLDEEQIGIMQHIHSWGKDDTVCQKIFGTTYTKKLYTAYSVHAKSNGYMFGRGAMGLKKFMKSSESRSNRSSSGGSTRSDSRSSDSRRYDSRRTDSRNDYRKNDRRYDSRRGGDRRQYSGKRQSDDRKPQNPGESTLKMQKWN